MIPQGVVPVPPPLPNGADYIPTPTLAQPVNVQKLDDGHNADDEGDWYPPRSAP